MVIFLTKQHRVFQEDIAYGLALLVALGERLRVPTPYIRKYMIGVVVIWGGILPHPQLPMDWPIIKG